MFNCIGQDCVLLDFGVTASSLFCLAQSAADQTTPTVITLQQFNLNQGKKNLDRNDLDLEALWCACSHHNYNALIK